MITDFWDNVFKHQEETAESQTEDFRLKAVVVAFEDNCPENSGKILTNFLAAQTWFDVEYYDDIPDKTFLNMDSRNFFDFVDTGKRILKKTKADVLVWGFRSDNDIRLNFQTPQQYEKHVPPVFALTNCLYLPLNYFQEKRLPAAVTHLICGAIVSAAETQQSSFKTDKLKEISNLISSDTSPRDLPVRHMPYILNFLALIYLHAKADELSAADIKIIANMLNSAKKEQTTAKDFILAGNIYANLGQLYQLAAEKITDHQYAFCRHAVECCRYAQKYFTRYTYPYDFGFLAYRISRLYYKYWKQVSDIQALRDAVFHLRDAEKIFSKIAFPYFWAIIQGDLGFYLSMLGLFSKSDEISMLAVDNYKKRQQVYAKDLWPQDWAKSEESIGNIYYNMGKQFDDEVYLEESIKYFQSAADVYENRKLSSELKQMKICVAKAEEYIMQLAGK